MIYVGILLLGIIVAYIIDFYLIKKHYRESKSMIDLMFNDVKKSMVAFLTIITFGLLFKDDEENKND